MSDSQGTIRGLVVALDGAPIANARVWAEWLGKGRIERVETVGDGGGRFRLESLPARRGLTLWAESPSHARERIENVSVFPDREHDVGALALAPGARVEGRVLLATGEPVRDATVTITSYRHIHGHSIEANGPPSTVTCDVNGRFSAPPLPAGWTRITMGSPGRSSAHEDVTIVPGSRRIVISDATLGDARVVTGVIVDEAGRPVSHALVRTSNAQAQSDEAGRFELGDVGAEPDTFDVHASGFDVQRGSLSPEQNDLCLTLTSAPEICGTVIDAETKQPVAFDLLHLCRVERAVDGSKRLYG